MILKIVLPFFFTAFVSNFAIGASYYFSDLRGNDSRTGMEAQHRESPWKSLVKFNSMVTSFRAGDSILFECGQSYSGNIIIENSKNGGTIYIGNYGRGRKPVFTGLQQMSDWKEAGNGIWKTYLPVEDDLQVVIVNDILRAKGRYPNKNAAHYGYLIYQKAVSNTSIFDIHFKPSLNWTGSEIVIHKNDFILDRNEFINFSGNEIRYRSSSFYEAKKNFGYFFQNHINTLDVPGEWWYNKKEKELYVFFGNQDFRKQRVFAGTCNTIVRISNSSNYSFNSLNFRGANLNSIQIDNAQHIQVQSCDVIYSGTNGVSVTKSSSLDFTNNSIKYSLNDGFIGLNVSDVTISKSQFINSGMEPGMGGNGGDSYQGIVIRGNKIKVVGNSIDSTGYNAIHFEGDSVEISGNRIDYFTCVLNDGGGIYTWVGGKDDKVYSNRVIRNNSISNGLNQSENEKGVGSFGVYLDHRTMNVDVLTNKIWHCSTGGLYLHNVTNIKVSGNRIFENGIQLFIRHDNSIPVNPNRLLDIDNNTLRIKGEGQKIIYIESVMNDISIVGKIDNNVYILSRNTDAFNVLIRANLPFQRKISLGFKEWQTRYGYDGRSQVRINDFIQR